MAGWDLSRAGALSGLGGDPLADALGAIPSERLLGLGKFAVPYGGLLRANFLPGETVVVNGASGYFGAAAVVLATALGASRVVAMARDESTLRTLRDRVGPRVEGVVSTGDVGRDVAALTEAAGGRVDMALDMMGRSDSTSTTSACLQALRRGGRLVIMGSATVPLPLPFSELIANEWHVMGCFMYPPSAIRRLAALVLSRQLDLDLLNVSTFRLDALDEALEAAGKMRALDLVALTMR